jgi:hypothetical protein
MGKGGSQSTSSNQTANYDQRVAAEGEGLALGAGAAIITQNEFGDNVSGAFKSLVDFATKSLDSIATSQEQNVALNENTLNSAADIVKTALEAVKVSGQAALATVTANEQAQNPVSATTNSTTNITKYLIIGAVVLGLIFILKKGK